MSKGGRFGGLSARLVDQTETRVEPQPAAAPAPPKVEPATTAKARDNKRAIAGYFSMGLSRQLRTLAAEEGTTTQALLGEALDLLMRARGKHPFNER